MDGLNHRGHPRRSLWAVVYAAAVIMGVLYLADIAEARSLAGATDSTAASSWQWTLFLGGLVGLTGNLAPRRRWHSALTIEAAGAASTAAMVAIYVGVIWLAPATSQPPYATIVWLGALAVALAGRVIEAFQQRRRALDYAAAARTIAAFNREG